MAFVKNQNQPGLAGFFIGRFNARFLTTKQKKNEPPPCLAYNRGEVNRAMFWDKVRHLGRCAH